MNVSKLITITQPVVHPLALKIKFVFLNPKNVLQLLVLNLLAFQRLNVQVIALRFILLFVDPIIVLIQMNVPFGKQCVKLRLPSMLLIKVSVKSIPLTALHFVLRIIFPFVELMEKLTAMFVLLKSILVKQNHQFLWLMNVLAKIVISLVLLSMPQFVVLMEILIPIHAPFNRQAVKQSLKSQLHTLVNAKLLLAHNFVQ